MRPEVEDFPFLPGPLDWALDFLSIPYNSVMGGALAAVQGKNILGGIWNGRKQNITVGDVLDELETQGVIEHDTAFLGSGSKARWASELLLGIGLDPITYLPAAKALSVAGRSLKNLESGEAALKEANKTLAGLGVVERRIFPDKHLPTRFPEATLKRRERIQASIQGEIDTLNRLGVKDRTLAKTMGERVAKGQQKFLGLGTIAPEATGAALGAVGKTAHFIATPARALGKTNVAQALKTDLQQKAGILLNPIQKAMRTLRTTRRGELHEQTYRFAQRIAELAPVIRELSDDQIRLFSDALRFQFQLGKEVPLASGQVLPKGSLVKLQFADDSMVQAVDIMDAVRDAKRGGANPTVKVRSADIDLPGSKATREAIREQVVDVKMADLEDYPAAVAGHPAFRDAVKAMEAEFANINQVERALGILSRSVKGYFPTQVNPRVLSKLDDIMRALGKKDGNIQRAYSTHVVNSKPGTLQGMSIAQINELVEKNLDMRDALDKALGSKGFLREVIEMDPDGIGEFILRGDPLLVQDPLEAFMVRGRASIKAVTNHNMVARALSDWSKEVGGQKAFNMAKKSDRRAMIEFMRTGNNSVDYGIFTPSNEYRRALGDELLEDSGRAVMREAGVMEIGGNVLEAADEAFLKEMAKKKAFIVPREVVDALSQSYGRISSGKEAATVVRAYDMYMDWWRKLTLLMVPSYYFRNGISNIALLWEAGMGSGKGGGLRTSIEFGKRMIDASKLQIAMAAELDPKLLGYMNDMASVGLARAGRYVQSLDEMTIHLPVTNETLTGRQMAREIDQLGFLSTGISADMGRMVKRDIDFARMMSSKEGAKLGNMARIKEFTDKGFGMARSVGDMIENHSRIALYLDRRIRGFDQISAMEEVRKHLFFFDELTDADRIMRRFNPFWMWKRFNVPLQLEMAIKHPEKFVQLTRAAQALESNAGPAEEGARLDWIKRNFGIRPRYNEETEDFEFFLGKFWIPMTEILDYATVTGVLRAQMQDLAAPIQATGEATMDMSFLTGAPLNFDIPVEREISVVTPMTRLLFGEGGTVKLPEMSPSAAKMFHLIGKSIPARLAMEIADKWFDAKTSKPENLRRQPGIAGALMGTLGLKPVSLDREKALASILGEAADKSRRLALERRKALKMGDVAYSRKLERARKHIILESKKRVGKIRRDLASRG